MFLKNTRKLKTKSYAKEKLLLFSAIIVGIICPSYVTSQHIFYSKYTEISNLNEWSCYWDSKYVELINVWIPFSETTEASPLIFSDLNNTEYNDIIPYTYKINFGPNLEII